MIVNSWSFSDKPDDKPQGMINDEPWWCAVADTEHGKICGRANRKGDCFVPYFGEKKFTNFKYVLGTPCTAKFTPQGY